MSMISCPSSSRRIVTVCRARLHGGEGVTTPVGKDYVGFWRRGRRGLKPSSHKIISLIFLGRSQFAKVERGTH